MKRRIMMLLMSVMMLLGMSQVAMADDVRNLEGMTFHGEYLYIDSTEEGYYEDTEEGITIVVENDMIGGSYVTEHGDIISWSAWDREDDTTKDIVYFTSGVITINGEENSFYSCKIYLSSDGLHELSISAHGNYNPGHWGFSFSGMAEISEERHISTGFTGTAVSDRGDYDLFIAGYFSKELTNGTHELTLSEIGSQTIAVVAHNNANGVNRNMNQSTIEEMTVTVSGGEVTEMIVRGRVQTNGGTLDRYTVTINP